MQISISVVERISAQQISQVKALINAATLVDEMAPLSEHVLIHINLGDGTSAEHILAISDTGEFVGYLHLDKRDEVSGPVVEVVVHPQFRGQKIGTQLVQFAMNRLQDNRLRLWAHGELMSAYALAKKLGFTKARELWQMRRSLYAELPKLELPENTKIKSFDASEDKAKWLELNAQVFADHPEQGRLDEVGLDIRLSEKWFKPEGFLISTDEHGNFTGYNWTKIHGNSIGHLDIGEIYVLGVTPQMRGTGLGRALAIAGLEYLRSEGLAAAMLYVDRDNTSAVKLYESIGFAHWDTDVMFQA